MSRGDEILASNRGPLADGGIESLIAGVAADLAAIAPASGTTT